MLKHLLYCLCVGLIILSGPQEPKSQPAQTNRSPEQRNANSQPSATPLNNPSAQINDAANAASPSQNQERDTQDDPLKAEQLNQNRIMVWATVGMAIFAGLNFVVAVAYAFYARKTLRAIKEQSGHAGEQVKAMNAELNIMKQQAASNRAQLRIAASAVRAAERNATAAEQSARIALEEVRPFLTLTAEVRRSDTAPEILVRFQNSGPSKATVWVEYHLSVIGSEPFIKNASVTPFIAHPNSEQTMRIGGINARQFDLVVRAGGGDLTLNVTGRYEGVGGPYAVSYCSKWVHGRDPHATSIDGDCEESSSDDSLPA